MIIRPAVRSLCTGAVVLAAGVTAIAPCAALAPLPGYRPPGSTTGSGTQAPALPGEVSALSWVVADATTGDVLASKDAHRHLPPASTLKTLFALTVLPRLPAHRLHTVTRADLDGLGAGSSRVGVVEGRAYRVDDLWRGVFLRSGGDAVHVLASMNGGWQKTRDEMRKRAVQLGAQDTHVMSPDGYDTPGQYSSAFDLAVFGRTGLADPAFARYCSTSVAEFPGGLEKSGRTDAPFEIQNTNRLLAGTPDVSPYPGLIGVKNGYTTEAGNTLIAAAHRGGHTLIVTVMNPQNGTVYEDARSLLDWGFAASGKVRPVGSLRPPVARTGVASAAGLAQAPAGAAFLETHHSTTRKASVLGGFAAVGALLVSLSASLWLLRRRMRR
ncbi:MULTISPECIES: D-alanyl-D-alanine carboxypeptidase [unclassified Streptomyces]|uniref:D-alanyl-D-alanine carboxypeptidase family protein n=1 Tax=unclassified Streptomyces TaxID=2593676 RepID=UPI002E0F7BC0|nr:D-alanyl-D-alanine carboxypeptidase [Streptomyces sp. NBC_01197]WSS52451.1 D-alanyl-D-alanine carboxypeptidase [Streptomyces sp. NBC_01180]